MLGLSHRWLGLAVAVAAGAALGTALASEYWGGLVPCALCLVERWPYRVLIALGLLAAAVPARLGRPVLLLAVLGFVVAAGLGVVHVGVERGAWPSPLPECAAPHLGGGSLADRLMAMPLTPSKPCDEPTYLIPGLPLSMAAMNLIFAAVCAVMLGALLWRGRMARRTA